MEYSAFDDPLGYQEKRFQNGTQVEQAARERFEYCARIAKVFKTKDGKALLKKWRELTIEAAAWSPTLAQHSGMDAANARAYAREGQNSFVRDIERCIEIATSVKSFDDFMDQINQAAIMNMEGT